MCVCVPQKYVSVQWVNKHSALEIGTGGWRKGRKKETDAIGFDKKHRRTLKMLTSRCNFYQFDCGPCACTIAATVMQHDLERR